MTHAHRFVWDEEVLDYVCIHCKVKLEEIINKDLEEEVCPKAIKAY